jgi:CheY-like chemotaxis protein
VESSQLAGRTILVVEDEPLVSMEIAEALTASGAHAVCATRIADAIQAVELHQISAGVLDINLGREDCSVLCHHLSQRQIPFVFYTGYAAPPDGWADAPVITKPADTTQIVDAVERLCGSHQEAA